MLKKTNNLVLKLSVIILLVSNYTFANKNLDSLKIAQYKNHLYSLDYIIRQIDNSKFYLNMSNAYCDSILSIDPSNKFASDFKKKNDLIFSTCSQNINHKIELFPFLNNFPNYLGFADDPIEYAYEYSFEKLLNSKYQKVQNGPISDTNISSILLKDKCSDEMFEIVNQILRKSTNHYIISDYELVNILGESQAASLINGEINSKLASLICEKLNLERLGIFKVNDIDVINNSIWLVQTDFQTFHNEFGFSEPIFSRGFSIDKRSLSTIPIILLIVLTIIVISILYFINYNLKTLYLGSAYGVRDLLNLFTDKIKFISVSSFIPLIFSFVIIYFVSFMAPSPETHYNESSVKLWILLLIFGISIIPTSINLFLINRLNLDGFHTVKGYRYFTSISVYSTFLPLFVFYNIQYETLLIYENFLLVGIVLIIGDLFAKSYFQFTSVTNDNRIKKNSLLGLLLSTVSVFILTYLILEELSTDNLLYVLIYIFPLYLIYIISRYYIKNILNKNIVKPINKESLGNVPFIPEVINPETAIFNKIKNSMSNTELNIMIVSGPGGIGKTRSLLETRKIFENDGWDWYYGDCDEIQGENAVSYEPFLEGFKDLLKINEFSKRSEIMNKSVGKALNIGASIIDLNTSLISDYKNHPDKSISEMCIEIIDKLEEKNNKTIFVMEDIHWIDPESYSFLNKFIDLINRNKFLRGNMCIVLSIREDSLFNYRGPTLNQLLETTKNLNYNSTYKFKVEELLTFSSFNLKDFLKHLSLQNNYFKIQSSSLNEINLLFNSLLEDDVEIKQITPLYILKTLEKWINDGLLKYSTSGYVLTRNIDIDTLPNDTEIDSYYHNIIDQYDEKWQRLLESASIIGNKFNADILAQVWGYELLGVLGFLEKAVSDELLIDISEEDNIYKFQNKRIASAVKSFFNKNTESDNKQIIKEYNKRYLSLQDDIIKNSNNYSVEEILSVVRRACSLINNEEYIIIIKKLILEIVVRLVKQEEEDKLLGFNSFLKTTGKLNDITKLISYLIKIKELSNEHVSKLKSILNDVVNFNTNENSIELNLRLFIILILSNEYNTREQTSISTKEFDYLKNKIFNNFKGDLQFKFAIELTNYTIKLEEAEEFFNNFKTVAENKNDEHNLLIELQELKLLESKSEIEKELIDNKSNELLKNINLYDKTSIRFKVIDFRLSFLANILENDEKAIDEYREHNKLLLSGKEINKHWVDLSINFLMGWSGSTYILKYEKEAGEVYSKCEKYYKKFIDFGVLSNPLINLTYAKKEYLRFTKKYKELEEVSLNYLKLVEQSLGVNNNNYAIACIDLGEVYGDMKNGEKSVEYRLLAIDCYKKMEQTEEIQKRLSTTYHNISHIYRNLLFDSKNAILYAEKALEIKNTKEKGYGKSLFSLGMAYAMDRKFKKATNLFYKALPYFSESSNKEIYQKTVVEMNLGIVMNEFDENSAYEILKKANRIFETDNIKIYISNAVKNRIEIAKKILNKQ